MITDHELAEQLQMSRDYVRSQCLARRWPHVRFGPRIRFTPEQVAAIIALHTLNPAEPAMTPEDAAAVRWGRVTRSMAARRRRSGV